MSNIAPVVTSIHIMVMPQQGLFSAMVKIMLAGETTAPLTFETAPTDNTKSAYYDALSETMTFFRDHWKDVMDVVENAQVAPAPPAIDLRPSRA